MVCISPYIYFIPNFFFSWLIKRVCEDQTDEPDLPVLPKQVITKIQQVVGSLLYYARAIDPTLLVALGSIACEQNKPTEKTAEAITISSIM